MKTIGAKDKEPLKRVGPFSGTNECECGGKVAYFCKRMDRAELGECNRCKMQYINHNRRRLKIDTRVLGMEY